MFPLRNIITLLKSPIHCRYVRRQAKLPVDPGLRKRLNSFKNEKIPLEEDVEEFVEGSESDFANVHNMYDNYEREKWDHSDITRQKLVQQKYFKENLPNLLTWSEKEQIRYLYSSNPEEWIPEKIAEAFPVTPDVVKKLVKYPWKPASPDRIARHDNSAMRNWKMLLNGELNLPPNLKEHVLKFSNRNLKPPENQHPDKLRIESPPIIGEFQAILDGAEAALPKKQVKVNSNNRKFSSSEILTLEELKESISKKQSSGKEVDISDEYIVKQKYNDEISLDNAEGNVLDIEETLPQVSESKNVQLSSYPEKITIPKNVFVKGATYRVKDCYYDYDGVFLYRVPGVDRV